jgi:hypothetical protein
MVKYEAYMRPLGRRLGLEESLAFMGVDMIDEDTLEVWCCRNGRIN